MSAIFGPLFEPDVLTADDLPLTPFGPITATTTQDGLEQMTNAINTANLLSATLFGAT